MKTETATTSDAQQPRGRRGRTSLLAHGEPMVWLTGGALVTAVVMIIALLALVLAFGLSTFWPMPLTKVTTLDGRTYMGEITREEIYEPQPSYLEDIDDAHRDTVAERLAANDGRIQRRLFRTGNFRITQRHFAWVDDTRVSQRSQPEWAMTIERLEWGRFYGFPRGFALIYDLPETTTEPAAATGNTTPVGALIEHLRAEGAETLALVVHKYVAGREQEVLAPLSEADATSGIVGVARISEGPEAAWQAFNTHHANIRAKREDRRHLEKHVIGKINQRQEKARLAMRSAEMALDEMEKTQGTPVAEVEAAREQVRTTTAAYDETKAWAAREFARVREEIKSINRQNSRYRMIMETAGEGDAAPTTTMIRLDDIVRAYPANHLTLPEKWGVYFSRWGEFLTAEPREANSEGGVFPAIFGTVAMTLIMTIIVVPFGVLASLYLREYAKGGPIVSAVRIAVNNLAGVPSIVFGVFGLGFFCYGVGSFVDGGTQGGWSMPQWIALLAVWTAGLVGGTVLWTTAVRRINANAPLQLRAFKGIFLTVWVGGMLVGAFILVAQMPFFEGLFRARLPNPTYGKGGLLWASLTLALLTLPVVIVATEEALSAVPNSMREGSYACGASKWQTIKRIVLPRAMPGIMTGMVLAMARGAGEVAPLMLVGAVKLAPELPVDSIFPYIHPERSFMHLGFHIFDVGFQSQNSEAAKPMVYTTTLLLILIVVLMNVLAIYLRNRLKRKFSGSAF